VFISNNAPEQGFTSASQLDTWAKSYGKGVTEVGSFANEDGQLRFNYYDADHQDQVQKFNLAVNSLPKPDGSGNYNYDCQIGGPASTYVCLDVGAWNVTHLAGFISGKNPINGIQDGAYLHVLSIKPYTVSGGGQTATFDPAKKDVLILRGRDCGRFLATKTMNTEVPGFLSGLLDWKIGPTQSAGNLPPKGMVPPNTQPWKGGNGTPGSGEQAL
jgi:hypothetical protein